MWRLCLHLMKNDKDFELILDRDWWKTIWNDSWDDSWWVMDDLIYKTIIFINQTSSYIDYFWLMSKNYFSWQILKINWNISKPNIVFSWVYLWSSKRCWYNGFVSSGHVTSYYKVYKECSTIIDNIYFNK